jgi:sulfatase modifying factor 1
VPPRAVIFLAVPCLAGVSGCLLSIDDGLIPGDASVGDASVTDSGLPGDSGDASVPGDSSSGGNEATSGAQDAADAQSSGDAEGGTPSACPSGMIPVPAPGSTTPSFCIDSTEVTCEAYGMFLAAANPPASGSQITECAWNTTYDPGGLGSGNVAAAGLNWCDAYAYCAWAGKRLCGAVGGGAYTFTNDYPAPSPSPSEWYSACSMGGMKTFPYGNQYEPLYCNGAPLDAGGPIAVATLPDCVGGYAMLFDMSGNVSEFLDSCATVPDTSCGTGPDCDLCLLVGGGFQSGADGGGNIECGYANQVYRKGEYVDNGFRCCADFP